MKRVLNARGAMLLIYLCLFGAMSTKLWAASGGHGMDTVDFPPDLSSYQDAGMGLWDTLVSRVEQQPFNLVALVIFFLAIVHTFLAGSIMELSHKVQHDYIEKRIQQGLAGTEHQDVSFLGKLLHFLGEIEAIFGIWVLVLFGAIIYFFDYTTAVAYVADKVNYTEPLFVVIIMSIAATRPILNFSENVLKLIAKGLGKGTVAAWWLTILTFAPLLGSFITEPAAMTIAALLLSKQFYRLKPNDTFKYATLGLLFVNVSVGGTLTNFAAPPVLMVAQPWDWSTGFMMQHFGWKAALGIVISNVIYFLAFRSHFHGLETYKHEHRQGNIEVTSDDHSNQVPFWIILVHIAFMAWTVINAHHPAMFVGGFLFFLGFMQMTPQHQNRLELKTAILVGFFLAGLVNHGGVQGWWISPVLSSLSELPLMLIATTLTAFNDNAAITYLATLVDGFSMTMKYAVVVGAVTGGGLTVIANAPNPAGQAILNRFFTNKAVNPLNLALGAIIPTIIMGLVFMLMPI